MSFMGVTDRNMGKGLFSESKDESKAAASLKNSPNMGGIAKAASLDVSAVCWQLVVKYSSLCCRELFVPFCTTRKRS